MSLPSGNYIITSKVPDGQSLSIGRNLAEDKSLLPKKVISLPPGVEAPVWAVQLLDNGKYILKIGGAATAEFEDKVFAVLLDVPIPTEWTITHVPQHGPNVYMLSISLYRSRTVTHISFCRIEKGDRSTGWVVPEEEPYTQIAVRPLIATRSLPPQYLPSEQFHIIPIE
ncbi:hypothetical protein EW026_g6533 [Hermanssonia centrifuga]|uniref:Uncharacterized protein n=1 Tax=Hermanssonia centrifuga TaxID=98765 RepID=A0A4S4KAW6_9APHY|nr:hypothetical protein EW026_g6533 [Hermanssonia centrifuga]